MPSINSDLFRIHFDLFFSWHAFDAEKRYTANYSNVHDFDVVAIVVVSLSKTLNRNGIRALIASVTANTLRYNYHCTFGDHQLSHDSTINSYNYN